MSKSISRLKYEASDAGRATIIKCMQSYRARIKRLSVVLTPQDLYLYSALLRIAYDRQSSLSSIVVLAIKDFLLRNPPPSPFIPPDHLD
jgi:hypothetical protein